MTARYLLTLADDDARWLKRNAKGTLIIGPQGDIHAGVPVADLAKVPDIFDLFDAVKDLRDRVKALEEDSPDARQARYEASVAMADLRASGWSEEEAYR